MIRVKYGPNSKGIQEIEVTPPKKDDLITYVKAFTEKSEKGQVSKNKKVVKPVAKSLEAPPASTKKNKTKNKRVWKAKATPSATSSPLVADTSTPDVSGTPSTS